MGKENNKRPSFQFYPKDYLSDPNVMAMSAQERGAYWHLIATMWTTDDCSLPNDEDVLARIAQVDKVVIRSLLPCYKVVNGRLRHGRLDRERLKQDLYREECSKAGKKGMANRWKSKRTSKSYKVDITKNNPSTSSSTSSPKISSKEDTDKSGKREDITKMVEALKETVGVEMFADSSIERNIGKHLVGLLNKIGRDEFRRRLDIIMNDDFKRKNCNSIRYLYNQLKSVPVKNVIPNILKI